MPLRGWAELLCCAFVASAVMDLFLTDSLFYVLLPSFIFKSVCSIRPVNIFHPNEPFLLEPSCSRFCSRIRLYLLLWLLMTSSEIPFLLDPHTRWGDPLFLICSTSSLLMLLQAALFLLQTLFLCAEFCTLVLFYHSVRLQVVQVRSNKRFLSFMKLELQITSRLVVSNSIAKPDVWCEYSQREAAFIITDSN